MKKIEINPADALRAYRGADANGKKLLITLIGKEFIEQNITDRVKTFEDALEIVGASDDILTLTSYDGDDIDMIASSAHAKLSIIAKALNEGWVPDWTDSDQYKYYPWFEYKAGVGFSHSYYDCWNAGTCVGSRLCFENSELAMYAGKQFQSIYNELFTL